VYVVSGFAHDRDLKVLDRSGERNTVRMQQLSADGTEHECSWA
jgi:hypothetical protein